MQRMTREQMATRVAADIPDGAYVNLGIGLPTMVANVLPRIAKSFCIRKMAFSAWGPHLRKAVKTGI